MKWASSPLFSQHPAATQPSRGRLTGGKKQDLMPWSRARSSAAVKDHWIHGWTRTPETFQECFLAFKYHVPPIITGKNSLTFLY